MAFSLRQRGQIVQHSDPNQYGEYLSATTGQVATRFADSAGSYADTLRQADTTNGRILKLTYGTSGAPTTVLDITKDGIKGGKLFDKGGEIFNVKAFETTANTVGVNSSTSADTVAIEAAIAALKAQSVAQLGIGGDGRLVRIHFPAGTYNIFRTIDLSGLVGAAITGDGVQSTRFGLATGSGAEAGTAAYWSEKPMMDVTGGNFLRLCNFSIQPSNSGASDRIPEVGLLMAGNAAFTNWVGSSIPANVANANYMDTVRVSGAFRVASHCNFACPSSVYIRCDFNREKSNNATYPNGNNGNQAALLLTRDNYGSSGAALVHAGGAVGLMNSGTDGVSCSDLTFIDCEIHDGCNGGTGACTCPALWLDECYDIRIYGGNISGHSNAFGYVRMSPGRASGAVETTGCRNIIFDGVFLYPAEGGGDIISNCFVVSGNVADDAAVVRSHTETWPNDVDTIPIVAQDVTIRNTQVSVVAGGSLMTGRRSDGGSTPTCYFIRWHVENVQIKDNASPFTLNESNLVLGGGGNIMECRDCYLEAHGNKIATNGGSIVRGQLIRPGAITSTTITHGEYIICGGGAASLAASGTVYYGMGTANATEATAVPVTVAQAGQLLNLHVRVSVAPDAGGGTQTLTYTLRKATPATGFTFADTALTGTITETSVIGADTAGAHAVTVAKGDVLLLKIVAGAGTTTNTWATWSVSCINDG